MFKVVQMNFNEFITNIHKCFLATH